jgi:hypothetical protein
VAHDVLTIVPFSVSQHTQDRLLDGETAYLDPRYRTRSVAERTLTEVIDRCFVFNPDDRADIFEIVAKLRAGLQEALQVQEEEEKTATRNKNGVPQEHRNLQESNNRIGRLGRIG